MRVFWLLAVLVAALAGPGALAQIGPNPFPTSRFVEDHPELGATRLRLRSPSGGEIRGPEVDRYTFELSAGEFAALRAPQLAGNIVVSVFEPGGRLVALVDEGGAGVAELATIEASVSGVYAVQIAMFEWDAPEARYALEWTVRAPAAKDPVDRARQLFRSWYEPDRPGAVLLVARGGTIVLSEAMGLENTATGRALTLDSPVELGSISKQFAAYAVAMLVAQGKLRLEDPVQTYLPEMPDYGAPITIQHLLEHTSGLRDWDGLFALTGKNIEDGITLDDVVAMAIRQGALTAPPGKEQRYTNTGYVLLAAIVQRVTGQPFDSWIKANVFAPLGMRSCSFEHRAGVPARVVSYRASYPVPVAETTARLTTMGSSGLTCSAHDLLIWLKNYRGASLGGPAVQRLVTQRAAAPSGPESDYVFGNWQGRRGAHPMIGHQGLAAGFRASIHTFPDSGLDVIYLANDGADATYPRVKTIENLLLGIAPTPVEAPTDNYTPAPVTQPDPGLIAAIEGRYRSRELGVDYEIIRKDAGMVLRAAPLGDISLVYHGGDTFSSAQWFLPSLTVLRGANGAVTGFRVESEDVGALVFQRVGL